MMIFNTTLLGTLLLAHPALPNQADGELVAHIFDLSAFDIAVPKGAFGGKDVRLLPLIRGIGAPANDWDMDDDVWEPEQGVPEFLASTFLMDGGVQVETVELDGDGMLYVEASAETIAQFEKLQEELASQLLASPRLQIFRFEAEDDLPAVLRQGGLVPRAALKDWIKGGRTVTLRGGRIHVVSDLESHTVATGVNIEIAQGVAAVEARVREAAVGSELTLAGYRQGDGVQLSYSVLQTQRRDHASPGGVTSQWMLHSDSGRIHHDDSARWSESFGVTGGAVAGEAHLTPDQLLVLVVGAAEGKTLMVAIGLDPASMGSPAVVSGSDSALTDSSWILAPRGLIEPTAMAMEWSEWPCPRTLELDTHEALHNGEEGILRVNFFEEGRSLLGRLIEMADIHLEMDFGGSILVLYGPEVGPAIARIVGADAATPRINLQVSVSGVDHLGRGSLLGNLTVRNGGTGAIVSGNEIMLAKELETEVAQHARVQMPRSITHFEGLAMTLELARAPGSQLAYRFRGQLSTDLSTTEGAANDVSGQGLVAVHTAHLAIDEAGVAKAGPDGTWKIMVGDPGGGGAFLEVSVRQN